MEKGFINQIGTFKELFDTNEKFKNFVKEVNNNNENNEEDNKRKNTVEDLLMDDSFLNYIQTKEKIIDLNNLKKGKLLKKEKNLENFQSFRRYFSLGGWGSFIITCILLFIIQFIRLLIDYWLCVWGNNKFNLPNNYYFYIYLFLIIIIIILSVVTCLTYANYIQKSAFNIFKIFVEKILQKKNGFF